MSYKSFIKQLKHFIPHPIIYTIKSGSYFKNLGLYP